MRIPGTFVSMSLPFMPNYIFLSYFLCGCSYRPPCKKKPSPYTTYTFFFFFPFTFHFCSFFFLLFFLSFLYFFHFFFLFKILKKSINKKKSHAFCLNITSRPPLQCGH